LTEQNENPISPPMEPPTNWDRISGSEDEVSLRALALVPLKRRRTVIGCAAFGLLAAILVSFVMTPKYRATVTIELNPQKAGGESALSDLVSIAGGSEGDLKVNIQTQLAVLKDDSIALAVMGKMGMLRVANPKRYSKEEGPVVTAEALPAKRREQLVRAFESNLVVKEIESSRLLAITYTSKDPIQAAEIANQVVVEYKSYLLNSNYSSSKEVSQWLAAQNSGLLDQVNKSAQAVAEFEHAHNLSYSMPGLATLGGGSSSAPGGTSGAGGGNGGGIRIPELDRLERLNEEVTQAEAVRLADAAIYRMTETQDPEIISSLGSSSLPSVSNSTVLSQGEGLTVLNALREREATVRVAYANAATKYGPKNPRLVEIASQDKSIQEQIQAEIEKIKQRAKNDLTLAEQTEKALQSALDSQKVVTSKMNDDIVQLGTLVAQARSSRELYDILYAKLQATNIEAGNNATNVTLVDAARPPGTPWMPQPFSFILVGLFAGLLFGTCLAVLLESQDDTLVDSFQVEAQGHVPVIGIVPYHKFESRTQSEGLLATESSPFLTDPGGATTEALRSLRSALTLSGVGRRLKLLSVTSALGGESKSYTVYNLAIAFAAVGLKVLIIDADLRRPTQHVLFRVSRNDGLSNLLAGMGSFDDMLQRHPVASNLFLLSAGQMTPLASELMVSGEVVKVLQAARERFDLVLVDNAPVLPVADPIQVASHCDGTIGVLRSGRTSKKALRRFVQILSRNRIHLIGMVIGAVDMSANEYRSVYGYNVEKYYGEK
jgi:capsular exopolysaccharide synthesis family protein